MALFFQSQTFLFVFHTLTKKIALLFFGFEICVSQSQTFLFVFHTLTKKFALLFSTSPKKIDQIFFGLCENLSKKFYFEKDNSCKKMAFLFEEILCLWALRGKLYSPLRYHVLSFFKAIDDKNLLQIFHVAWRAHGPCDLPIGTQIIAVHNVEPYLTLYRGAIGTIQTNDILFYPSYKCGKVNETTVPTVQTLQTGGTSIHLENMIQYFILTDEMATFIEPIMMALSHQFRQAIALWPRWFKTFTDVRILILVTIYQWSSYLDNRFCRVEIIQLRDFIWTFKESNQSRLFLFLEKALIQRGIQNVPHIMATYALKERTATPEPHLKRLKASE